jgi:hypothetical protein
MASYRESSTLMSARAAAFKNAVQAAWLGTKMTWVLFGGACVPCGALENADVGRVA